MIAALTKLAIRLRATARRAVTMNVSCLSFFPNMPHVYHSTQVRRPRETAKIKATALMVAKEASFVWVEGQASEDEFAPVVIFCCICHFHGKRAAYASSPSVWKSFHCSLNPFAFDVTLDVALEMLELLLPLHVFRTQLIYLAGLSPVVHIPGQLVVLMLGQKQFLGVVTFQQLCAALYREGHADVIFVTHCGAPLLIWLRKPTASVGTARVDVPGVGVFEVVVVEALMPLKTRESL